ncbi:Ubiquitin-conjugating enzyme E2 1 [Pseudocercospora fuligena]|uniref:Ubiquitin-conjugating enzyme E2 1 n=1 Tax=Pseudocercospora fuligena TaxID=685502 RepID=A0A8H6VLC5_9PEZI|nr:Ubiquitin-conjugating enzyme E2 1 [Pseudocercospora fuligena]
MAANQQFLLERRLKDINELQEKPYPGIRIHIDDADLTKACLVLEPEGETPLHLTLDFSKHYPLVPPDITIQSSVSHPNVFDDRICINILSSHDGYTPAYTLKGICIQMLSFFFSDSIEQMYGENGGKVDRKQWQGTGANGYGELVAKDSFQCDKCDFGASHAHQASDKDIDMSDAPASRSAVTSNGASSTTSNDPNYVPTRLVDMPGELLLVICDHLDDESLLLAARAWNGFGRVMRQYNIIRTRELQCFTLKQGFSDLDLGIGIHVEGKSIQSEFDIISRTAFKNLQVRRSIQGLSFEHWLPLPIAQKHWMRVRNGIDNHFKGISKGANVAGSVDKVIYSFMNEVVVKLSTEAENLDTRGRRFYAIDDYEGPKSTLTAASEKAIESYFHLFHLLLCLACERSPIPNEANNTIKSFIAGNHDKQKVPNLGYLLIMILISEVDVTPELIKAIIEEAVTRNVVWMLDKRGRNMAELSFLETSAVSEYRLQKTFEASKTSYRLLMFLNVMRKVVRSTRTQKQDDGSLKKLTLAELRDELFNRHGAPPNGAATKLAEKVSERKRSWLTPRTSHHRARRIGCEGLSSTMLRGANHILEEYANFPLLGQGDSASQ